MPGRDALSPLFLSADTCTGVQVVCVCSYICVCLCLCFCNCTEMPVKCTNLSLSARVCVCVTMCAQCVRQCLGARSATLEAASFFLLGPNQSEEWSVTMSPAVWADGLFKTDTDNSSSATTLPHALIASNEVMKATQRKASLSSPVPQGAAALVCAECLAIKNNWEAGFCLWIFQECQLWSNEASLGMLKAESAVWQRQLARIIGKKIIIKKKIPRPRLAFHLMTNSLANWFLISYRQRRLFGVLVPVINSIYAISQLPNFPGKQLWRGA